MFTASHGASSMKSRLKFWSIPDTLYSPTLAVPFSAYPPQFFGTSFWNFKNYQLCLPLRISLSPLYSLLDFWSIPDTSSPLPYLSINGSE